MELNGKEYEKVLEKDKNGQRLEIYESKDGGLCIMESGALSGKIDCAKCNNVRVVDGKICECYYW